MLIGLSGYARTGKDTVAGILAQQHGYTRVAFADALKAVAEDVNPIVGYGRIRLADRLHWHDEDPLNPGEPEWEYAKTDPEVRRFLQNLGVACREHIDPDVWVNAALGPVGPFNPRARIVISDVRFENEARAVKDRGGEIWRITRPGVGPLNGHVSETGLDQWPFDRIVDNRGTVEELAYRMKVELGYARTGVVVDSLGVATCTFGEMRRAS